MKLELGDVKIFYPVLVKWENSLNVMAGEIKYFESKEEAESTLANEFHERGPLRLIQWNPEGYPSIKVKYE